MSTLVTTCAPALAVLSTLTDTSLRAFAIAGLKWSNALRDPMLGIEEVGLIAVFVRESLDGMRGPQGPSLWAHPDARSLVERRSLPPLLRAAGSNERKRREGVERILREAASSASPGSRSVEISFLNENGSQIETEIQEHEDLATALEELARMLEATLTDAERSAAEEELAEYKANAAHHRAAAQELTQHRLASLKKKHDKLALILKEKLEIPSLTGALKIAKELARLKAEINKLEAKLITKDR